MKREGIVTYGVDRINYNKNSKDPRIRSCWVTGEGQGVSSGKPLTGDVRQKRGPEAGHVPVICDPVVEATVFPGPDGAYADCTFGRGGHSDAMLRQLTAKGRLFAFDVDPSAIAVGRMLEEADSRFRIFHRPFGDLAEAIPQDVELSGVTMDLGVSSPQLDEAHRGFSVIEDGPLDLRMNPSQGLPASAWLETVTAEELAWVIRQYGEDEDPLLSARIAEEIITHQREHGPFRRTRQLADVIREAKRGLDDRSQHPAKLSFQAIRTWINQEFQQFEKVLHGSFQRLKLGGRCVVICFKRQETTTLQHFIRCNEECDPERVAGWPPERVMAAYPLLQRSDQEWCVQEVCNPIAPTAEEMKYNNRSRSARGHVLEKRMRTYRWRPPPGVVLIPAEEMFVRPQALPRFGGAIVEGDEDDALFLKASAPSRPGKGSKRGGGAKGGGASIQSFSGKGAAASAGGGATARTQAPVTMKGQDAGTHLSSPGGTADTNGRARASVSIEDWLLDLDGGAGKLECYGPALTMRFASVAEISHAYVHDGHFDAQFFEDFEVKKAAHRRYFERWLQKN